MRFRLHSRLVLWNLILIALTAGILDFILNSYLRSFLEQRMEDQLLREVHIAAAYFEAEASRMEADDIADTLGELLHLRVTLIGPDGRVLGESELDGAALASVENHASRPEVRVALASGSGTARRASATLHTDFLYIAQKTSHGVLRLAIPLRDVETLVAGFRSRLAVATIAALATAFLLGYGVLAKVSRPIQEIAQGAKRLAGGDLAQRFPLVGDHEVAALSAALNAMALNLSATIAELSEGKRRLEQILRTMNEGLMVLDREGLVRLANQSMQRIAGTDRDLSGRSPLEVLRNEDLDRAIRELFESRTVGVVEIVSGSGRTLDAHLAPMLDPNGQLDGAVIVFHDVTDIRRTERMRRDFVANVSHEFKTPLTSIRGYAETLNSSAVEDPSVRAEFLGVIERNARYLESLVADLLTLARIEAEMPAKKESVELQALIADLIAARRSVLEARQVRSGVECPPLVIQADRSRLSTALSNLIDNAILHNKPEGEILISAQQQGGAVVLSVADTGQGIPEPELPRIFERFYRVDKSRARESGGTGLGLAIARHAIESQGGKITVESQVGKGSKFSIRLEAS